MEHITLPQKITVEVDKKNPHKGTVVISSLYPGYGYTVAHALRRVLLSSLKGGAIYAFKIKGVKHEFTTIEYVKEDVVDISLNLKRVNIRTHSQLPVQLELKSSGAKVITAGDITPNADIEIANPDQPILTLTDKAAQIEMTLWVKEGSGYEAVESREDDLEVNAIAIDAIYSPIVQVGYRVDNVRVGKRTDYDQVTFDIETNGTIGVEEAVVSASGILAEHFKCIAENMRNAASLDEEAQARETEDASPDAKSEENGTDVSDEHKDLSDEEVKK